MGFYLVITFCLFHSRKGSYLRSCALLESNAQMVADGLPSSRAWAFGQQHCLKLDGTGSDIQQRRSMLIKRHAHRVEAVLRHVRCTSRAHLVLDVFEVMRQITCVGDQVVKRFERPIGSLTVEKEERVNAERASSPVLCVACLLVLQHDCIEPLVIYALHFVLDLDEQHIRVVRPGNQTWRQHLGTVQTVNVHVGGKRCTKQQTNRGTDLYMTSEWEASR